MKNLVVKSIIVVCTLILFNNSCFAEIDSKHIRDLFAQNKLEEIENTLNSFEQTTLTDEEQAEVLLYYAELSVEKAQFQEACEYAFKAKKFIPEDNNKLKAQANLYDALSYFLKKDIEKTFSTFDLLEQECIKYDLKEELANIYVFKAYILKVFNKDNEAIDLYNKALPLYIESKNLKKTIDVELLIAEYLNEVGKYDQSLDLALKVLKKNVQLKNPKKEALLYKLLAVVLLAQDEFDQALEYIDKAINLSKMIKDDSILNDAYFWKGMIFISQEKYDLAEELYLKSIEFLSMDYGPDHPIVAPAYVSLSVVYSKQAQYSKALKLSLKAHNIFKKAYGDNHTLTANTYNQIAEAYKNLGQYEKALELYYKSMERIQSNHGSDDINILYIYNNIGSVFFKQQKYHEALDWYNKALLLSKKYFKEDHFSNSKLYNDIALCFDNLGDYDKALEYLNKSLNIINQKNKSNIMMVIGYTNLACLYEKQNKLDKAEEAYLKALKIIEENNLYEHLPAASTYDNFAVFNQKKKNYVKALYYYQEALEIKQKFYGQKNIKMAFAYYRIAGLFNAMNEYEEALKNYKIALELMKTEVNDYYFILLYFDLAHLKLKQKEYKQAITYYKKAMEHYNSMINYTAVKNDKYNFADRSLKISENIIKCFIALNEPKQALFYSDKSRYQDLVNSLSYKKALLSSFIDKNEAKKLEEIEEKYTKMNSLCLQSSIGLQQMDDEASIVAKADNTSCKEEIFVRKELSEYIKQLDKKYPRFSKTRFNSLTSSAQLLEIINNKHLQNTAIIEYYLGEAQLYIFVIFNSKVEVITANYTDKDMENLINKYNKPFRLVSLTPTKGLMIDILKKYDLKTSYDLYQILLEKPIEKLQTIEGFDKDTSIIIVPHKSLYYLSFESLITENIAELKKNNNIAFSEYQDLPYFINNYKVSYLPSLSFLEFIDPNKHVDKDNVLVVGNPDLSITRKYTQSIENLKQLPHSENESKIIHNILGTKSDLFIGDKATEKMIDSKTGDYNTYHFACHGIVNDNNPLYSGLVLSREPYIVEADKNKGYDGILYAYEILNKNFNAKLVVLSACDSGLGKLQSGEGMLGLTKSFLVAGVNSLVITLWKINDESSSLFMKDFYTQLNLNRNQNTLQALRKAKLTMIETVNEDFQSGKYEGISYSHPYFWAPFVYNGY